MMTDILINRPNMRTVRLHLLEDHTYAQSDPDHPHSLLWATDSYPEHAPSEEMTENAFTQLESRYKKSSDLQRERTKKKGEVFTPVELCDKMNNHLTNQQDSETNRDSLIQSRCLEIACGEAPFLVSRTNNATGELIPLAKRIGLLDRKLQWINKTVNTREQWENDVMRAFTSTYGYEYQGDSLLIARLNLLNTYADYYHAKWNTSPSTKNYEKVSEIISWNLWQMDGLPDDTNSYYQDSLDFDLSDTSSPTVESRPQHASHCSIRLWENTDLTKDIILFTNYDKNMRIFDYVIGNPPYQEATNGAGEQAKPLYHFFVNESRKIAKKRVVLITPSRWFTGGMGLNKFRESMLNDRHLKTIVDYTNAKDVFPSMSISGGINYFVWDKDWDGDCSFTNIINGKATTTIRDLRNAPLLIRYNQAVYIIKQIRERERSFSHPRGYNKRTDSIWIINLVSRYEATAA
ncbi:MAG: Eco57I restriction-modification methylase domain-containing protein [Aeriscardovia sp.]|nr:Eco57I restriction-modification methylase domain-containing protein [Aeriscardovia sp.]